MKLEIFNTEANNIWGKAASKSTPGQLQFELGVYNKLFNFFQVGECYYMVFSLKTFDFEFVSKEMTRVTGYDPEEFTINAYMDKVNDDDRMWILNYENKTREFLSTLPLEKLMKYKARYDLRFKRKDGREIRILHQSMVIEHDAEGQILRTLAVDMDITHLKPIGKPMLSFIGLDDEPSYIDVKLDKRLTVSRDFLSKREKQILLLIAEGKLSKEISEILHISKQTVDSHRSNMIMKNSLKNTNELVAKAIRQGWI